MAWMAGLYRHPPIFIDEGSGARFRDVDGNTYLDMNQSDMSMNCGYGPPSVVVAGSERLHKGSQFLLPTEDAIVVSELLAERFGIPYWQYTLSASSANTEAFDQALSSRLTPAAITRTGRCFRDDDSNAWNEMTPLSSHATAFEPTRYVSWPKSRLHNSQYGT